MCFRLQCKVRFAYCVLFVVVSKLIAIGHYCHVSKQDRSSYPTITDEDLVKITIKNQFPCFVLPVQILERFRSLSDATKQDVYNSAIISAILFPFSFTTTSALVSITFSRYWKLNFAPNFLVAIVAISWRKQKIHGCWTSFRSSSNPRREQHSEVLSYDYIRQIFRNSLSFADL